MKNKMGTSTYEKYLNKAFSAPRICTVDDGCFARFKREPTNK